MARSSKSPLTKIPIPHPKTISPKYKRHQKLLKSGYFVITTSYKITAAIILTASIITLNIALFISLALYIEYAKKSIPSVKSFAII